MSASSNCNSVLDMVAQPDQTLHEASLAVLMTCHNRVNATAQSLRLLKSQIVPGVRLELILVDDGSSDDTSRAVADIFPDATILSGDGNLFWSGGMRLAFGLAMQRNYDFFFWLNDDTNLYPDALERLVRTYREVAAQLGSAVIIVGSTCDPSTGLLSYGGWRQQPGKLGLISWEKIAPDMQRWIRCDTFNGNCVLIPRAVVERVGNLDSVFRHGIGDLDYGLRAIKSGCQVMVAPGYYGACKSNEGPDLWSDSSLPLYVRWKKLLGPKGFPVKAWGKFAYRHKGNFWFLSWIAPYILFWLKAFSSLSKGGK